MEPKYCTLLFLYVQAALMIEYCTENAWTVDVCTDNFKEDFQLVFYS